MINDIHINIGTEGSSSAYEMPYQSYYYKNKVQFVITKSELLSFGIVQGNFINSISLKSTSQPSRDLSNFRIRIGQTDKTILTAWEKSMVLVWQGTVPRTELVTNTYKKYNFIEPYEIGDDNLVIEVSRDETTGANSGAMGVRNGLTNGRMISWRADGGFSFPFDTVGITSNTFILDVILSINAGKYKLNGTYVTPLIVINEPFRVSWIEEKPIGTDIVMEYATEENPNEWIIVKNYTIVSTNSNIYLRSNLSTIDNSKTPKLLDLWIEPASAPQDKILITFEDLKRFNNVEGNLTVLYDASKGNLSGLGGAVESFTEVFTPTDLIPEPNPHIEEYISVAPSIEIDFITIDYVKRYVEEYISASPEIEIQFIDITIENP